MKQFLFIIAFAAICFSSNSQNFNQNPFQENSIKKTEFKVYPNPCKNQKITIEIENDLISEIRISNIAGKVVFVQNIETPIQKKQIELANIPNGIYLLQIKTAEKKKVVKKLMVSSY